MGWLDRCLKARPRVRRVLIGAATAIGLSAFTALMFGVFDLPREQRVASQRVEHTLEVLEATSKLEADLERTLVRARGFIIAGKTENRASAEAFATRVADDLSALNALTGDHPDQRRAIDNLRDLIEGRLALLHRDIELKAGGDDDAVRRDLLSHAGRGLMEKINATLARRSGRTRSNASAGNSARRKPPCGGSWPPWSPAVPCRRRQRPRGDDAAARAPARTRRSGRIAPGRSAAAHHRGNGIGTDLREGPARPDHPRQHGGDRVPRQAMVGDI